MANNNNRKPFLAMNAGMSVNKKGEKIPYAFHVEAFVAREGTFYPSDGNKPAMLSLSVGVGRNPWLLLGKEVADEQANNPDVNENSPFVNLTISGYDAERLKNIQKGAKVLFTGRVEKNTYKKKSGEDAVSVRVRVNSIYQMASRNGTADEVDTHVSRAVNVYESRGGEVSQALGTFSGEVKSAESLRTTSGGREVISAKLELAVPALEAEALINGTYDKEAKYGSYKTVTISVWGQKATHMDRVLVPGNKLVVTGAANINKGNDDKQYVNVTVRELSVLQWATPAASATGNNTAAAAPAGNSAPADFEELADAAGMNLPF